MVRREARECPSCLAPMRQLVTAWACPGCGRREAYVPGKRATPRKRQGRGP